MFLSGNVSHFSRPWSQVAAITAASCNTPYAVPGGGKPRQPIEREE